MSLLWFFFERIRAGGRSWTLEWMHDNLQFPKLSNIIQLPSLRKGCVITILFGCVPRKNYKFYLLHVKIGIGIKIVRCRFDWIDKQIKLISSDKIILIIKKMMM